MIKIVYLKIRKKVVKIKIVHILINNISFTDFV